MIETTKGTWVTEWYLGGGGVMREKGVFKG